jgi:predicted alpha/beta-hydrolase family hydrolase
VSEQRLSITWREGASVSAALEVAGKTCGLVVAHGAGGNLESPFLVRLASGLAERQVSTLRFNFPYTERGRKLPDPAPALEECYRAMASKAAEVFPAGAALLLGGKSMGGRIASQIASGLPNVRGLVFLGYPLHAPGKQHQPRDKHLYGIRVPMLFVQGTRDAFADQALLRGVLERLGKAAQVHWIEGADHSFKVTGRKPAEVEQEILETVAAFAAGLKPVEK